LEEELHKWSDIVSRYFEVIDGGGSSRHRRTKSVLNSNNNTPEKDSGKAHKAKKGSVLRAIKVRVKNDTRLIAKV
jgi:hypothetical protein